eukprot:TRINITY_DN5847_c1_g1_i1.p2 TRINITY_DN5847_c1_g1~~TRINITY_DN5847_c1_g1_i1.p2  ORF type:complete len:183 (-),score=44.02 TRINITY_DN5847_c1_g1_i1:278-826(-)
MPRGILKKSSIHEGHHSRKRAGWDEDNLEKNEVIKAELNPTKIDEPKTPYHAPVNPDAGDMEPLDLEGSLDDVSEEEGSAAGADTSTSKVPKEKAAKTDDEELTGFDKQRKQHYNMKNALALGRALQKEEDDDQEEEEEWTFCTACECCVVAGERAVHKTWRCRFELGIGTDFSKRNVTVLL